MDLEHVFSFIVWHQIHLLELGIFPCYFLCSDSRGVLSGKQCVSWQPPPLTSFTGGPRCGHGVRFICMLLAGVAASSTGRPPPNERASFSPWHELLQDIWLRRVLLPLNAEVARRKAFRHLSGCRPTSSSPAGGCKSCLEEVVGGEASWWSGVCRQSLPLFDVWPSTCPLPAWLSGTCVVGPGCNLAPVGNCNHFF